ncbi:hypothetical protein ACFYXM_36915 [Streptomyces sp. NPDC002476]|uniref:hypothetical protein n=1 Tax=Streptomyces sp. NPDC002476 TaxID=3364648 RepID=UPI00369C89A6
MAGLIAMRPGSRTRLCYRLRTHPSGKGKRRSMSERDFTALVDGTHQLIKGTDRAGVGPAQHPCLPQALSRWCGVDRLRACQGV